MSDTPRQDMSDKDALRREVRTARAAFVATLDPMAHRLAFHALPSPIRTLIADCTVVALYAPVGDEAPATRLADALLREGKTLCLPHVVDRMGTMEFRQWSPGDTLEDGPFGTQHPLKTAQVLHPDAIFAPLVAFDDRLMRLGQGGGYYDRAFARYEQAIRIGLGWSVQQIDRVPADPWDMPLHRVVTERGIFAPTAQGDELP